MKNVDSSYLLVEDVYFKKWSPTKNTVGAIKKIIVIPHANKLQNDDANQIDLRSRQVNPKLLILFSSGTTGIPNPVIILHRAIIMLALIGSHPAFQPPKLPSADAQERTLFILPMYYAMAGMMVYHSLFNGHLIVTHPSFSKQTFLSILQDFQISNCFVIDPMVQFLAYDDSVGDFDLSSLKSITAGGSLLSCVAAKQCMINLKNLIDIRMIYGLTEMRGLTWLPYGNVKVESIGVLLPNTNLKIVNPKTGAVVKTPLAVGEMWFSGEQVHSGYYYKNDVENSNVYVKDDGIIWGRTGDLGYIDEDGFVYFVDRIKNVLKFNAKQVYPGELENLILSHNEVADCAVFALPTAEVGDLPTAAIVLRNESAEPSSVIQELNELIRSEITIFYYSA